MASGTELAYVTAAAMLDNSINTLLNSGAGNAIINIYTGAPPANCEAAVTGTLLGTCVMSATPFGAATDQNPGARITANAIAADLAAVAGGVAGYFRAYSSDANTDASKLVCYVQGTAGEAADATDMTLDVKTIVLGGTISVTSWTLTQPEA